MQGIALSPVYWLYGVSNAEEGLIVATREDEEEEREDRKKVWR